MKQDDIYTVDIIDEDNNGNGIARIDNFVIFVSYALKDEKVKITITDVKKKYAIAKIIEVLEKSESRIDVKCSCYNECGGCSFLHVDKNYENNAKIKSINKLFNLNETEIYSNNEYNYRNKATFHIKDNKIGYYSENSHELIEFDNCVLLDERINKIYNYFKNIKLTNINEVMVRTTKKDLMIKILGDNSSFNFSDLVNNINITSIYLNNKLIYGKEYIVEDIYGMKFALYSDAFFQINTENMMIMYDIVKDFAGEGNKLLDLYCGTGTIGIYLSKNYKSITGIEINKSSIECANINKSINGLNNIKFTLGDSKIAKKDNYDTIIVDPPRVGLSKDVINYLNDSNSDKIIYVSCNPITLKRDLDLLNKYHLSSLKMINMFNKTKHVECVALFKLKN